MRAALRAGAGRPFTRRRRSVGRALAAGLALALGVAFASPASAQTPGPATQGTARAYGLSIGGLVTVAPTPQVSVGTPGVQEQTVVPVDADPLVINGTLTARAECQVNPTVAATLAEVTPNNCRGYAITESLDVLLSGAAGVETSLVSTRLLQAEAVGRCVGGRGQLATGYKRTFLSVFGQDLTEPVDDTLDTVLQLVGANDTLAGLVQVAEGEVTRPTPDSIAINGVHVRILPTDDEDGALLPGIPELPLGDGGLLPGGAPVPTAALDIIISRAEARMPTPCGVAAQQGPAAGPDLGAGPAADLPRTGSNEMVAIPVAAGLLATAVVLRGVNRRARRATA